MAAQQSPRRTVLLTLSPASVLQVSFDNADDRLLQRTESKSTFGRINAKDRHESIQEGLSRPHELQVPSSTTNYENDGPETWPLVSERGKTTRSLQPGENQERMTRCESRALPLEQRRQRDYLPSQALTEIQQALQRHTEVKGLSSGARLLVASSRMWIVYLCDNEGQSLLFPSDSNNNSNTPREYMLVNKLRYTQQFAPYHFVPGRLLSTGPETPPYCHKPASMYIR